MNSLFSRASLFILASTVAAGGLVVACSDSGSTSSSSGSVEEDAGTPVTDSGTTTKDSGTTPPKDSSVAIETTVTAQVTGIFAATPVDGGVPDAGGGAVSPLVLQNNGKDDLTITKDGSFPFATKVSAYAVTVKSSPLGHTCTVTGGSGTATSAATTVQVTCTRNEFVVTADVKGLKGTGLLLQNNGKDDLAITAVGAKPFTTKVKFGEAYAVTVKTAPTHPTQLCTPDAAGIVSGNVTVNVDCKDDVFPSASYPEVKTFTMAAGEMTQNVTSLAFDGTKYWTSSGNGNSPVLTTEKIIASYSAAGVFDTSYMTAGNGLSLFSVAGKGNPIYYFGSDSLTKVRVKDAAGGLTDFISFATPLASIAWPVMNQAGTEIITLTGSGTIKRAKASDGTNLPNVVLNGYGSETGENSWYTYHVIEISGYYVTLAGTGKVTAWDPATGARVKSTLLANWDAAWEFPASIAHSYANGMLWVFDGTTSISAGKWHGYDIGL